MTGNAILQLALYFVSLLALAWPLGTYMAHIYAGKVPVFVAWLRPVERAICRLAGVRGEDSMPWTRYAIALLVFNLLGTLAVFTLQRLQDILPVNPEGLGAPAADLAFNTAVSFATNTNWQAYSGESTMSHLTQMLGLGVQNFVSAATGMAVLVALARSFVNREATAIGNFWVDLLRSVLYILLPLSLALALALVSQGVVQTFDGRRTVELLEPVEFEQLSVCVWAEQAGNPLFDRLGVDAQASELQAGGNMEGKETRFGVVASALWATATTAASNGSVNAMHDSFTPLGGMVPMWLMQLGEVIFGGVGSGLYGMIVFALVAVFVAGLMIGRTPEYLGKKIEGFEVKMAAVAILVPPMLVLVGTAVAVVTDAGRSGIANPGAHGFSEVLYAFSSAGNNNGSAFAGLSANTPFYNILLGVAMLFARYWLIVPVLAIAGSLAAKKTVPAGSGTLPTHTPLFVLLLIGTVIVVGALTFLPALALGPVVEHLQMIGSR